MITHFQQLLAVTMKSLCQCLSASQNGDRSPRGTNYTRLKCILLSSFSVKSAQTLCTYIIDSIRLYVPIQLWRVSLSPLCGWISINQLVNQRKSPYNCCAFLRVVHSMGPILLLGMKCYLGRAVVSNIQLRGTF